jgi:hypothetical protein
MYYPAPINAGTSGRKTMSAFVVEDKVINDVVNFLATARRCGSFEYHDAMAREFMVDMKSPAELNGLGVAMFQLNCNAVDQRYGAGQAKEFRDLNYLYTRTPSLITPIQAYKSLGCWLYQCAEGTVPESSLLYMAMERVHAEMAHNIVSSMPAYEQSAW